MLYCTARPDQEVGFYVLQALRQSVASRQSFLRLLRRANPANSTRSIPCAHAICDAYSDQLMTVRVPCQVPADYLPVGFFYDPQLKVMECVPVLSMDANSVTLGLRHFCILGVGFMPLRIFEDIKTYDTGFQPGVDDFNRVNNGSSLEPDGHCLGQCLTMQWYYINRKLAGEASLWNRFDNYGCEPDLPFITPTMQDDDVMALRLASVAQKEVS